MRQSASHLMLGILAILSFGLSPAAGQDLATGLEALHASAGEQEIQFRTHTQFCSHTSYVSQQPAAPVSYRCASTTCDESGCGDCACAPCGECCGGICPRCGRPRAFGLGTGSVLGRGAGAAYGRAGGYGQTPWSAWVFAAPTYAGAPTDSFGFSEGVTFGYRVFEGLGVYAGAGFNHTEDNTQFLGTVGLQRFGDPNGASVLDRASVWVLWDQFTVTDTDAYTDQLRFNIGYVPRERTEVGMTFSVPTSSGAGAAGQVPLGGSGLLTAGDSAVGPYVTRPIGDTQLSAAVVYSEGSESAAAGVGLSRPVSGRTSVFMDAKFAGDDEWAMAVGLKWGFGGMDTTRW